MSSLTHFLNLEGRIQTSTDFDIEEGEIVQNLTKEQVAELLGVSVDKVYGFDDKASASEPAATSQPANVEDFDDVEIEDASDEEGTSTEEADLPEFADIFHEQTDEVLNRKIDEKVKTLEEEGSVPKVDPEELVKLKQ